MPPMARSLIVWGLDAKTCSQELAVLDEHGCKDPVVQNEEDAAWCAASLPSLTAAEACKLHLQRRFRHLRVYIEPDWQAFGSNKATAVADLIQLAERLGCRDIPANGLPHEAVCLVRGVSAILPAIQTAGGPQVLATADLAAAVCLAYGLLRAVNDDCRHPLSSDAPQSADVALAHLVAALLRGMAAEVHRVAPDSSLYASVVSRLAQAFLLPDPTEGASGRTHILDVADQQLILLSDAVRQDIALSCVDMLRAIGDAFAACLARAGSAAQQHQQQQQPTKSTQQSAKLANTTPELQAPSICLAAAAGCLLNCTQALQRCHAVDKRQLLDTHGQLIRRVVSCVQLDERLFISGLGPGVSSLFGLYAAAVAGQLHLSIATLVSSMDETCAKRIRTLLSELASVQQLAITWLAAPLQNVPLDSLVESPLTQIELLSPADQTALLLDANASRLAAALTGVLSNFGDDPHADEMDIKAMSDLGILCALAATLQVAPSRNLRGKGGGLAKRDSSSCLAPGWHETASALSAAVQPVTTAAAAGRPWAGDAAATLVHGALGSLRLAHAEAAAQEAQRCKTLLPGTATPDRQKPHTSWLSATDTLTDICRRQTPLVSRALSKRGLVGPLLQAMPSCAVSAADPASWSAAMLVSGAIGDLLTAVLAADTSARRAVLRDGSWDAAVQRFRNLQPPPELAAEWAKQREALLRRVAAVLEGSRTAAADAAAVAAAERAMLELLAEEQPTASAGQRSKAAAKRARKKAAQQQAAKVTPAGQPASRADPTAAAASTLEPQAAVTTCSSAPVADAQRPPDLAPSAVLQPASSVAHTSPDNEVPPAQQSAAGSAAAAEADWWRCPLSGQVMRDPVLYGSEGHSFEREALEEWLAANPGVDPLSGQPLPLGGADVLPNHALRNMIQQLQMG